MTHKQAGRKGGLARVPKGIATLGPDERSEFGKLGGSVKCPKGLAMYTPEQRAENARRGAAARWARYRANNPENNS